MTCEVSAPVLTCTQNLSGLSADFPRPLSDVATSIFGVADVVRPPRPTKWFRCHFFASTTTTTTRRRDYAAVQQMEGRAPSSSSTQRGWRARSTSPNKRIHPLRTTIDINAASMASARLCAAAKAALGGASWMGLRAGSSSSPAGIVAACQLFELQNLIIWWIHAAVPWISRRQVAVRKHAELEQCQCQLSITENIRSYVLVFTEFTEKWPVTSHFLYKCL